MSDVNRWLVGLGAGLGALAIGGLYIRSRSASLAAPAIITDDPIVTALKRSKSAENQTSSAGSADETVDSLRIKGNEYYKAKQYAKATKLYQQALDLLLENETQNGLQGQGDASASDSAVEPTDDIVKKKATLFNNLSACSERMGQFAEAAVLCLKCLELQNDYTKAWSRLEKTVLREKQVQIELYEYFIILTALSLYKNFKDVSITEKAENALMELSQKTAAHEFTYRVVGSFPTVSYLRLYWRSFTSFHKCDFYKMFPLDEQSQLQTTQRELENRPVKPHTPPPSSDSEGENEVLPEMLSVDEILVRATLNLVSANYKSALIDFERVTKHKTALKAHRVYSQIQIAAIFSQMGQTEMAILHFAQAEQISTLNPDVFYHRAQLNLGLGRLDAALVDFQQALHCQSSHSLAASYVGLLEFQKAFQTGSKEEQERAMDDFASKMSIFPDCAELYALYAQCEVMRENYEQAISLYDKCYEIDGSNANALCHKAMILLRMDRAPESIALLSRILREIDENNEFVYETLGSIANTQGDLESAIDSYAKAISCSRNRQEIYQFFARYFTTKARLECRTRFGLDLVE